MVRNLLLLPWILCLSSPALAEVGSPEDENGEILVEELTVIRVTSTPVGAEISIDGHPCGQTPGLISVSPGRHEVILTVREREARAVVMASSDFTAEVDLDFGLPAETGDTEAPGFGSMEEPPTGAQDLAEQSRDTEQFVNEGEEEEEESWARQVTQHPWLELRFVSGAMRRGFEMPIDPTVDLYLRELAALETSMVAMLGFQVGIFPFVKHRYRLLRGLGVEGGATMALGLDIFNSLTGERVDASYYETDAALVYAATLGRPNLGAVLSICLGWHRTNFELGPYGNDLVPPFTYDAVRLGFGVRAPLGTQFVLAELRGSYLGVVSIGEDAENAYGEEAASTNGGEVQIGLIGRAGALEFGLSWVGRWFSSEHIGTGEGWGEGSDSTLSRRGIRSTDKATDSYHQLRITVGFRL